MHKRKAMLVMLILSVVVLVVFCLWKGLPARKMTEDFFIDLYIKIVCEK